MKIASVDVYAVRLPFRVAFGHSLATRSYSDNLIVRVKLDNGSEGWGEGVPREYVTGEDLESAYTKVKTSYAPCFIGLDVSHPEKVIEYLTQQFQAFGLESLSEGSSWCALELAVLDAVAHGHGNSVAQWLGSVKKDKVRYGAVVPFCGRKALIGLLLFYKLYGFQTVKLKVGRNLDEDVVRVKLARRLLGRSAILRVDANSAWSVEETLRAAERMREFDVVSYEQPVSKDNLSGLIKITASIPEEVVVDESLTTMDECQRLIETKACSGINIRISKVGGLIAARRMLARAQQAGLKCHLGAQVGESGILSAAARILACLQSGWENIEGSNNALLLKEDLTFEDMTVGWGGFGKLPKGLGLGVSVHCDRVLKLSRNIKAGESFSFSRAPH